MSRPPPHDLSAEAAVLSAAALDASGCTLDEVRSLLNVQAFYSLSNKVIFESMCRLADTGKPTDVVTIWNQLRAADKPPPFQVEYLAQIIDATPSVPNVLAHARIVQDFYLLRRTREEARRIEVEATTFEGTDTEQIHDFLQRSEQSLADLAFERDAAKLRPIADVLSVLQTTISNAFEQKTTVTGIPTGFDRLDRMMTGLQDGDVTVVAARPGMGKTAFLLEIARAIALIGYAAAFFSLEMPAEQIALRLLSVETAIEINNLRSGRFDPGSWPAITEAMKRLAALPLYVDDTPGISALEIRARVRRLQRDVESGRDEKCTKRRLGMVGIDYLQLMKALKQARSREEEVGATSRSLKEDAKTLKVPYAVNSQLNRDPEKRPDHKPRLSDLRESGSIEQDADNVLFIHRPEVYKPDDEELKGWAEIIVAKQRNGPVGSSKLAFRKHCTRFANLSEDDDFQFSGDDFDDELLPFDNPL